MEQLELERDILQPIAFYAHVRRLANPSWCQRVFLLWGARQFILLNRGQKSTANTTEMLQNTRGRPSTWNSRILWILHFPARRCSNAQSSRNGCTPDEWNFWLLKSYSVPPNSPDLNPVDYKIWGCRQEIVYETKARDVEDLCKQIMQAWNDLDQRIIDSAVREWLRS